MAGWDGGVSSGSIGSFHLIEVSWNLQLPNFEPSENSSDQRWSEFQSACDVRKCFRLVCAGGIPSRLLNDSWRSVSVDLLRFNLFEPQVVGSVPFSTARPYFGFPPAVSSEDPAMFFFEGVGDFSKCSKDATICTCQDAESCFETIPSVYPAWVVRWRNDSLDLSRLRKQWMQISRDCVISIERSVFSKGGNLTPIDHHKIRSVTTD